MNIINIILVIFLLGAIISLPVFVIVVLVYNTKVKKKQNKLDSEVNDDNVKAFIKIIKFGPFLKNDKIYDSLKATYKKVKKNTKVNKNLKNELYNVLIKKGCKEKDLR